MCHVIFGVQGISSQMAPNEAVNKIENLLISTTEKGSQDHKSLLAAYKLFEKYLTQKNIERPVVVLSDGHGSRFDFDVLLFLREHQIRLFLGPPDTTGVTQLLDQVNKGLHEAYNASKKELFSKSMKIDREGFMIILANMWNGWVTSQTLRKAAKRVGVKEDGLSLHYMEQSKFVQAAMCTESEEPEPEPEPQPSLVKSPEQHRRGSAKYWQTKYEELETLYLEAHESSLNLDEVPGLLVIDKVKPKQSHKYTRVTQVYGSMEGKDVLNLVKSIQEKKDEKAKAKEDKMEKKEKEKELFLRCKEGCVCKDKVCKAAGLKECPRCGNVIRSVCSRVRCQVDGEKPKMICLADENKTKCVRKLQLADEPESDGGDSDISDESDEHEGDSDIDMSVDEASSSSSSLDSATKQIFLKSQESLDEEEIQKGSYYCVYFDEGPFWGRLTKVFAEDEDEPVNEVEIDFLRYSCGYWDFPKNRDIKVVQSKFVFYGPCRPSKTCRAGYMFAEDDIIRDLYKKINA